MDPDQDQHSVRPDLDPSHLLQKVICRQQNSPLARKELNGTATLTTSESEMPLLNHAICRKPDQNLM